MPLVLRWWWYCFGTVLDFVRFACFRLEKTLPAQGHGVLLVLVSAGEDKAQPRISS